MPYEHHKKGDIVRFTNESEETIVFDNMEYQPGEMLSIVLNRNWTTDEGLGEGGPWGWGGFSSEFVFSLMQCYAD